MRRGKRLAPTRSRPTDLAPRHQQAVVARRGGDVPGQPAARFSTPHQNPRRCERHHEKAVPAEGDRQCPSRCRAAAGTRRSGGHIHASQYPSRLFLFALPRKALQAGRPDGRLPRRCVDDELVLVDKLEFDDPEDTKTWSRHPEGTWVARAIRCSWPSPEYDVNVYKSVEEHQAGGSPSHLRPS